MTKTDETTQTESCNLIVCEILCYVQNKIDNINHDYIVKTVADFYNESDIHTAKRMLCGCCKDTALRFKCVYTIVNKQNFNECRISHISYGYHCCIWTMLC